MGDNALIIDVTAQLSGIIMTIPKRGWLPSAPLTWAPMIGWLRGRDTEAAELEGLDELMGSVQTLFNKANAQELNRILEKLSVFSVGTGDEEEDEDEEHTKLICLAFRRVILYIHNSCSAVNLTIYGWSILILFSFLLPPTSPNTKRFGIDGPIMPEVIYSHISVKPEFMI